MGIEYKIVCDPAAVSRFDEFIRRQPFIESYDAERRLYNLRVPGASKTEDFPDGYAKRTEFISVTISQRPIQPRAFFVV